MKIDRTASTSPGEAELQRYRLERKEFEEDRLYGDLGAGLFSPWDFNTQGNIFNWLDLHETTEHNLSGMPDLDLNDWVIDQQRACLNALNTMGFDGYRIDAVKHCRKSIFSVSSKRSIWPTGTCSARC